MVVFVVDTYDELVYPVDVDLTNVHVNTVFVAAEISFFILIFTFQ